VLRFEPVAGPYLVWTMEKVEVHAVPVWLGKYTQWRTCTQAPHGTEGTPSCGWRWRSILQPCDTTRCTFTSPYYCPRPYGGKDPPTSI
jgi:hypothetical protein